MKPVIKEIDDAYEWGVGDDLIKKTDGLSLTLIKRVLNGTGSFTRTFDNQDQLVIQKASGNYYGVGNIEHLTVMHAEYDGDAYMITGSEFYPLDKADIAIAAFITRIAMGYPAIPVGNGYSLEDIAKNAVTVFV